MLTALAFGARELASLPVPPSASTLPPTIPNFPSKQLPGPLHRKYLTERDVDPSTPLRQIVDSISHSAIESGKNAAEQKVPQIVRERQLRISKPAPKVTPLHEGTSGQLQQRNSATKQRDTFTNIAAEYFLGPLIGKFWLFLRDEQTRESRTALFTSSAYRGAGNGLVLSPLVLSQFLNTVTVLAHAARHSPAFLAVLAPDTLELAVTVGTRPMSSAEAKSNFRDETATREAVVLTASLELALVVLDGCQDADGGKSLGLEHASLLVATGEWAGKVLGLLEDGVRVAGEGGKHEMRLRRSAAGLVLKVDELTSRWRLSMITI